MSTYPLAPFGGSSPLRLEAILRREGERIMLCYLLRGRLGQVAILPKAERPKRRDELWRRTCFELFFGPAASPGYHEVNLSPAGHWNVYAFDDYRQNMRSHEAVDALAFTVAREEELLAVVLDLPLAPFQPPGIALRVGLAAVLADQSGSCTYWALAHAGDRPDFHRPENFAITVS